MEELNDKQPFFIVPQGLVKKYGWTIAGVYSVLLHKCKPPIYEVTITRAELSVLCGTTLMTIRRSIEKLIEIDLIERITTAGGANVYKVVPIVNARIHQHAERTQSDGEPKQIYGEYKHVLLSESEYESLINEFRDYKVKKYIKKVDEYCQQHGTTYSDYAFTIRKWIREDQEKQKSDSHHLTDEEMEGYLRLVNRFRDDD